MTDLTHTPHYTNESSLKGLLDIPVLQLLLAGMYFVLGLRMDMPSDWVVADTQGRLPYTPCYRSNRRCRRYLLRKARRVKHNNGNLTHLKVFMPKGISHTQFVEGCARLSIMGRLKVYNFLYHRWEFYRYGAIKLRCRLQRSACVRAIMPVPGGLCDAHIAPD